MTDDRDPLQSVLGAVEAGDNQERMRLVGLMRRASVPLVNIGPHGK